jgi:hypothetical protein
MVKGLAAPRAIDTMLDMYLAQTILDAIDRHTVPILVGFSLAMVLQNIAMITAVVMTRRECWISISLIAWMQATHALRAVDQCVIQSQRFRDGAADEVATYGLIAAWQARERVGLDGLSR